MSKFDYLKRTGQQARPFVVTQPDPQVVMSAPTKSIRSRKIEASLLPMTLLLVVTGLWLAWSGRTLQPPPPNSINLSTADSATLKSALNITAPVADALRSEAVRRGGFVSVTQAGEIRLFARGTFGPAQKNDNKRALTRMQLAADVKESWKVSAAWERLGVAKDALVPVKDLVRLTLLEPSVIRESGDRLIVRTTSDIVNSFAMAAGLLIVAGFVAPVFLRRRGVEGDGYILPCAYLLAGFGAFTMLGLKDPWRETPVFIAHANGIVWGIAAFCGLACIPRRMRVGARRYPYIFALSAAVLLGILGLFGHGPESVRLSLLGFQPVELIKVLFVLFTAGYLCDRSELLRKKRAELKPAADSQDLAADTFRYQDLFPFAGVIALAGLLFIVVRDFGPAQVLILTFGLTLYGVTSRPIIPLLGLGVIIAGIAIATVLGIGVVPVRVGMWLNPWHNAHPNGMQLAQSLWAFASSGWSGAGAALGLTGSIPRGGTDLVFSSFAEEFGLPGVLLMMTLYVVIVWRGLSISQRAEHPFDRALALGITMLFAVQALIIIFGVTGILPLTGISLPLIAYGKSSMLMTFACLGLLRGISSDPAQDALSVEPAVRISHRLLAQGAAIMLVGVVGLRCWWLQSAQADPIALKRVYTPDADHVSRAKQNPRLAAIERNIPRGRILDRSGTVLAGNEGSMEGSGTIHRSYPMGAAASLVVGISDPRFGGPTAAEWDYRLPLKGYEHISELLDDYHGRNLPRWLGGAPERKATDVKLTIDSKLQRAAFDALKRNAKTDDGTQFGGAFVALDIKTGEVLSAASYPAFDPNETSPLKRHLASTDKDQSHSMLDRSRQSFYPPGSTLKVAVGATALQLGSTDVFTCEHTLAKLTWHEGAKYYARLRISDDEEMVPHGRVDLSRAIERSCNVYFAQLGVKLGSQNLTEALYGSNGWMLAKRQAVDQLAPELATSAFGQGRVLVSPLEMARIAAAIANGGVMPKERFDHPGPQFVTLSTPINPQPAAAMAQMMRQVTIQGTAHGIFDSVGVSVAGKTGSAQVASSATIAKAHSWFIGFAPADKPRIAFACVIEHGGAGRQAAAPAVKDFLMLAFPHTGRQ